MTDVATALYQFWSGFGLPAYVEGYIPDSADGNGAPITLPYITYQLSAPEWRSNAFYYARVWYRSTSYSGITAKIKEISDRIGEGISIPIDGGMLILYKSDNFCQFQPFEDDSTIKMAYLSMQLNVYTE